MTTATSRTTCLESPVLHPKQKSGCGCGVPPASRLDAPGSEPRQPDLAPPKNSMRGGWMIGVLERASTILAITVAEPTIIAAIVAIKAVGRFGELAGDAQGAAARMRERFLVGSLASLTVAGLWGVAAWLLVR